MMDTKIRFWLIFLTSAFIIMLSVTTVAFSPVTMEEGEVQNIAVGGNTYHIEILIIEDTNPITVTFKVNNQITSQLTEGSSYALQVATLEVLDIILNEAGEAGSGDTVVFTFKDYCGDHLCNREREETCSSCVGDCGCQSGYLCKHDQCQEIVCGDGICDDGETCYDDNCCNGNIVDLYTNKYSCGACGNRCGYNETCKERACQKERYCGDGICEDEEQTTCRQDCEVKREKDIAEILSSLRVYKEKNTTKKEEVVEEPKNEVVEQEQPETVTAEPQKEEIDILERFILWLGQIF